MIWNWIINIFRPQRQKDPHEEMYETPEYTVAELEKMTKGDLKKLVSQGKIKGIAYPFY
tara:strand:+ start:100 stop:276 length:177 start_codon:yes stop_codon:yes gene_type:complete